MHELSETQRHQLDQLLELKQYLLKDIRCQMDLRMKLLEQHAPAEKLNSLTEQLTADRLLLGETEEEIGRILDLQYRGG